ncbi:MAG: NUDIX hydrolase [Myxococcales bacterium]|nr:NUDIX hydrolase [Myxococcales bacterium]
MRHPRAWQRVADGEPADYGVLKVRRIRVEDPRDGSEHPRVLVEAPDWVNVIPVTREGKLLLVRQFRFGVWANTLEIPGGMAEPGEPPEGAAARELEEETGYRAAELVPLGVCHPNPAIQTNRTHSFLALGCERVHEGRQDPGEDIALELVTRDELERLLREGAITHALVLVAFLFERLRLGGR